VHRPGDLVSIYISENTNAGQEAGTNTSQASSVGADFTDSWNQTGNNAGDGSTRKQKDISLSGQDAYNGLGKTSRKSVVTARVSAVVTEVLPNGNLRLLGERQVKVNEEIEVIKVKGEISPSSIGSDNSVFSYQLANAEISVNGVGVVGSKQSPGIMTRLFGWLF